MFLDYSVWIVMLISSLLSLALLGYRMINNEPCTQDLINVNGRAVNNYNAFYIDSILTFNILTQVGDNVSWDFGDNLDAAKEGSTVTYQFSAIGNYQVKVTIKGKNSRCEKIALIKIKTPPPPPDRYRNIRLEINGHPYTVEGATEGYTCNVVADSYKWRLVNKDTSQVQDGASARFTFPKSGIYTIELTLDNNPSKTVIKEITAFENLEIQNPVRERPPVLLEHLPGQHGKGNNAQQEQIKPLLPEGKEEKKTPAEATEKPKKKEVLPETFKLELDEIIALKKTPEEVAEKYLFYSGTTKVKINNESSFKSFTEFCYQMRNSNSYKLESVLFDSDAFGITVINVKLKKIRFINRILHRK